MEENLDKRMFAMTVPYNNKVLVENRKKIKIPLGIITLIGSLGFVGFTVIGAIQKDFMIWVPILFGVIALYGLIQALYYFFTIKPSKKDEKRSVRFEFYENYLFINQTGRKEGKNKVLEKCLYRSYKNRQYIKLITEFQDRIQIKIRVGSYNGVPQYRNHVIPKSIFKSESLNHFTNFLKGKVGSDYIVK